MAAERSVLDGLLDRVEAALLRHWPELPEPTAEAIATGGAFGSATMAYPQWLRYVFVPAARVRIATGDLPTTSSLGVQAVREFDGVDELRELTDLLGAFDVAVTDG